MHKGILILRPGALGDILVLNRVLGGVKMLHPRPTVFLMTSGEKGSFLKQESWVDAFWNLQNSDARTLYSPESPLSPVLQNWLKPVDTAFIFGNDPEQTIAGQLKKAGVKTIHVHPSRPETAPLSIRDHLLIPLRNQFPEIPQKINDLFFEWEGEEVQKFLNRSGLSVKQYGVIHPGSGSLEKNWPLEHFNTTALELIEKIPLVVVSGEADGKAGESLYQALGKNALHFHQLPLRSLAKILSGALFYLGNDSGVSHLASLVRIRKGNTLHHPFTLVLFGPSSSLIWGENYACCLQEKNGALHSITPERVLSELNKRILHRT